MVVPECRFVHGRMRRPAGTSLSACMVCASSQPDAPAAKHPGLWHRVTLYHAFFTGAVVSNLAMLALTTSGANRSAGCSRRLLGLILCAGLQGCFLEVGALVMAALNCQPSPALLRRRAAGAPQFGRCRAHRALPQLPHALRALLGCAVLEHLRAGPCPALFAARLAGVGALPSARWPALGLCGGGLRLGACVSHGSGERRGGGAGVRAREHPVRQAFWRCMGSLQCSGHAVHTEPHTQVSAAPCIQSSFLLPLPRRRYAIQWWLLPVKGPGLTSSLLGLLASASCLLLVLLLAAMLVLSVPTVRCGCARCVFPLAGRLWRAGAL